jgi:precorrin-6Y C5,15-methyltransferase (decarboxylating)
MERLLKINPNMQFVIYTLDLGILAQAKLIFDKLGIKNMEAIQISVSKTNKDNMFVTQPSPWLITGGAE